MKEKKEDIPGLYYMQIEQRMCFEEITIYAIKIPAEEQQNY